MVMYFLRSSVASTITMFRRSNEISAKVYAHVSNLSMCERSNLCVTKQYYYILHKYVSEKTVHKIWHRLGLRMRVVKSEFYLILGVIFNSSGMLFNG